MGYRAVQPLLVLYASLSFPWKKEVNPFLIIFSGGSPVPKQADFHLTFTSFTGEMNPNVFH